MTDGRVKEAYQHNPAETTQQDKPRVPEAPVHRRNESLHQRVVKREHARAVSNHNLTTNVDPGASGQLWSDPVAASNSATVNPVSQNLFGENSSSHQFPPPDPARTHRRKISGPLATKVEGFTARADDRRRSRENSPNNSPPDTPTVSFGFGDLKSGSAEESVFNSKQEPKMAAQKPYIPPSKRGEPKPWLSKNWRET